MRLPDFQTQYNRWVKQIDRMDMVWKDEVTITQNLTERQNLQLATYENNDTAIFCKLGGLHI